MSIAQLSIDLVAKIAEFEKDLKRATHATQQQTNLMAGAFNAVKGTVVGLASAFSVGFAVNFVRQAINSVDALNDLKDATGASIENISALEDTAARTGTSFETVGTALVKFNGALKDAKPGSDAQLALEALGLSVSELKRLDPAEALLKTATAWAGFADDGNKARITNELFGKSVRVVAPLLNDLAEKGTLVATITAAQAQEAEKFNKELFAMQKNVQDVTRVLSIDMVTAINKTIEKIREARREGDGWFGGLYKGAQVLLTGDDRHKNNVDLVNQTDQLMKLENKLAGLRASNTPANDLTLQRTQMQIAGVKDLLKTTMAYRKVLDDAESPSTKEKPSLPDSLGKVAGTKAHKEGIDEASRSLATYVEGLQRNLEKNDQLTESEKALSYLRSLGVTGEIPQVRELVLGLAQEIDKEKDLTEVLKLKREAAIAAGDAINKSNEEYQSLLSRLLAATPSANLETQRRDVGLLTAEFESGRISEALYLEAVTARLDLTAEKIDKTKSAAEELGLSFASAFEDAVISGKELSGVIEGLAQDMLRLTLRKTVTEPLANYFSAGLGALFGFADGGVMSAAGPMPLRKYAGGGVARSPQLAMFGEGSTPEAFVPLPDGRNIPVVMRGGGGGRPVVININAVVGDVASKADVVAGMQATARQIQASIGRSQQYGGAMS
jgi:hypothetical protein